MRRFLRLALALLVPLGLLALACNFGTVVEPTEAIPTWALPSRLTATALAAGATGEPAETPVAPESGASGTPAPDDGAFHAGRVDSPPGIDAELSDWRDLPYPAIEAVFGGGNRQGADDLLAAWNVAWDDERLYLALEVRDDVAVQLASGNQIFRGDSVEVLFDADLEGDAEARVLNADDYQLGLSPGDLNAGGAPEAYLWFPRDQARTVAEVAMAAALADGGYRLEAAIPWAVLGVASPTAGQSFGFAVSVSDDDTPGGADQESMVSSSPGRILSDPATWGVLVLDPPN